MEFLIHENASENIVWLMAAILSREMGILYVHLCITDIAKSKLLLTYFIEIWGTRLYLDMPIYVLWLKNCPKKQDFISICVFRWPCFTKRLQTTRSKQ